MTEFKSKMFHYLSGFTNAWHDNLHIILSLHFVVDLIGNNHTMASVISFMAKESSALPHTSQNNATTPIQEQ